MKKKITLLFTLLFIGLNTGFAQQDEECMTKLSIFHEYVKAKNYDAAYQPWMDVRNKCPKFNILTRKPSIIHPQQKSKDTKNNRFNSK